MDKALLMIIASIMRIYLISGENEVLMATSLPTFVGHHKDEKSLPARRNCLSANCCKSHTME